MTDTAMLVQQMQVQAAPKQQATTMRDIAKLSANTAEGTQTGSLPQGTEMMGFSQLLALLQQNSGQQAVTQQTQDDAAEKGAQMLAEMLAANPGFTMLNVTDATQQLTQLTTATGGSDALMQLLSRLNNQTVTQPTAQNDVFANTEILFAGYQPQAVQPVQPADDSALLQAQSQFNQSVQQAQQLFGTATPATATAQPVDVDELQKKVDAGAFVPPPKTQGVQVSTGEVQPLFDNGKLDPQDILEQLQTGVTQNVAQGKDNFVVTLKPQGLGEITVKMLQENGKITMSIMASNTNVQRMLNDQLPNLREVMKPYQVEVQQVTAGNSTSNMDMQQQLQQQSFAQHGQQQQRQTYAPYVPYQEDGTDASIDLVQLQQQILAAQSSGIDTYI
ncbi:MAG: flagellar hook-length control protein FliK [Oscillospiraceae bacterium]|nr:flagellar hook-length control protein FliK [Oscillospiraceae bacterium]